MRECSWCAGRAHAPTADGRLVPCRVCRGAGRVRRFALPEWVTASGIAVALWCGGITLLLAGLVGLASR
jgi:hypothetical protein